MPLLLFTLLLRHVAAAHLGLCLFFGAIDAAEDVVDLCDGYGNLAVLDELHPLALRHGEAISGRLGSGAAALGVLEEEGRCDNTTRSTNQRERERERETEQRKNVRAADAAAAVADTNAAAVRCALKQ